MSSQEGKNWFLIWIFVAFAIFVILLLLPGFKTDFVWLGFSSVTTVGWRIVRNALIKKGVTAGAKRWARSEHGQRTIASGRERGKTGLAKMRSYLYNRPQR